MYIIYTGMLQNLIYMYILNSEAYLYTIQDNLGNILFRTIFFFQKKKKIKKITCTMKNLNFQVRITINLIDFPDAL